MLVAGARLSPRWGAACWLAFFALVLAAWAALFAMSADFAARAPIALLGPGMGLFAPLFPDTSGLLLLPGLLESLCLAGAAPGESAPLALFAMWALMALAMMAPTAVPLLATYGDFVAGNPARVPASGFFSLLAGFCLVWLGFAGAGGLAQWGLARAELMTFGGQLSSVWLAIVLLLVAGAYQFSALKAACLSRCRSPLAFFFAHWRDGPSGAFWMGLRQGAYCLGCCWALMALAFVGGTMNLLWMGIAMVLMTLEKLPTIGRRVSAPLGGMLIAAAALLAATTLTA
ncbi:MAG: DUF2182 domain-containing protein [Pseudomonadota bacterium]